MLDFDQFLRKIVCSTIPATLFINFHHFLKQNNIITFNFFLSFSTNSSLAWTSFSFSTQMRLCWRLPRVNYKVLNSNELKWFWRKSCKFSKISWLWFMGYIKLLWYLLVWSIGHCGGDEHNYVRPIWTNLVQWHFFQSSLSLSTTFLPS